MKTIKELDDIAKEYADSRQVLSDRVQALEDEIEAVKRKYMPTIRHAANKAKTLNEKLGRAVDESRDLFKNPKTMTIHGIKFGLQKSKDDIDWEDEDQVIKRIKKLMVNQVDVLVNIKESLHKSALKQLSPADLKKIGIVIVEGTEQVLIKDTNSEIDKLVKKLLDEEKVLEEAA